MRILRNAPYSGKRHNGLSRCAPISIFEIPPIDYWKVLIGIKLPTTRATTSQRKSSDPGVQENLELLNPLLPGAIERLLYDHFFNGCREVALPSIIIRLVAANPAGITRPKAR